MKPLTLAIPVLTLAATTSSLTLEAQDSKEEAPVVYAEDFEQLEPGEPPASFFVIDGTFEIFDGGDQGRLLRLDPAPLVEASVQVGKVIDGGGTVQARIRSERKGRSTPRFGVGLHGLSGYRLRVVPSRRELELVRDNEVIQAVPFEWQSGVWYFVELSVLENGDSWTVTGRAWAESDERPGSGQIEYIGTDEGGFRGKASLTGTPYAGTAVDFDDLKVTPSGAAEG